MVLNYEQIKAKNLIANGFDEKYTESSYNLTIENILDIKNKIKFEYILKPQGMAYVFFREKVTLPTGIIGFAHVKTSLTQLGIMAINIGIIDTGYSGYISTLLINFGKHDYILQKGDTALRLTFWTLDSPTISIISNSKSLDYKQYQTKIKQLLPRLGDKFLNLNTIKEDSRNYIIKIVGGLALIFTAANFAAGFYFNYKSSKEIDLNKVVEKYELKVSTLNENQIFLQEQIKNLESKLNKISHKD